MTNREYARYRGCTEKAVRKALAEGRITAGPDGNIDPVVADRMWAENTTRPLRSEPTGLANARERRLRADVTRLRDELSDLRADAIVPRDAKSLLETLLAPVIARLRRLPSEAASIAGLPADAAERQINEKIRAALEEVVAIVAMDDPAPAPPASRRLMPRSSVELATEKTELLAERAEMKNWLRSGAMIRVAALISEIEDNFTTARSLMLAIPGRIAHLVETATDEQVRAIIESEMGPILSHVIAPPPTLARALQ